MAEDSVAGRIRTLTAEHLQYVAQTTDGWERLYRDPIDGRHWELTYQQGEMQGGGPQVLMVLSAKAACEKYGTVTESNPTSD